MKLDLNYRSDIDGLRGIAVLFVLTFHGFAKFLPGGFIGVDIFFVISGYLITSILFNDLIKNRFSISRFYARRIKRIFPALIVVLGTTCILGWFLLYPGEIKNLGKHVVGGAVFISNILLWKETGYFNSAAEFKPLLHLWSLGIEEQFYLFFPVALWFADKKGFALPRFLAILLTISFGFSIFYTLTNSQAAFFLPVTRLWELLVGCILAAIERERNRLSTKSLNNPESATAFVSVTGKRKLVFWNTISCLGIALIFYGAFCINKGDAFPGWWALMPTIGTALVIAAGKNSLVNQLILGNKLLVSVGLISYPLYLWHWPLLYFGRIMFPDGMSNLTIVAILAASGLLATLTYFYIESPVRFGNIFREKKVFVLGTCMTAIMVFGFCMNRGLFPSRLGLNPLSADVDKAANDYNAYPFHDNSDMTRGGHDDAEIVQGKPNHAILFVGDSHLERYWPRIELALNKLGTNARPVILTTRLGTPALPNVNRVGYHDCDRFFDFAMQEALKTNVSTVVFCCFWEAYFIGVFPAGEPADIYRVDDRKRIPLRIGNPDADQVFVEFGKAIFQLTSAGKEVIVILPGPCCSKWDPKFTSRFASLTEITNQVRVARKDFEAFIHPVKNILIAVVTHNGGKTIDPLDYFEENGFLNGKTAEGRFRYIDESHFRPFYVRENASFIDPLLHHK